MVPIMKAVKCWRGVPAHGICLLCLLRSRKQVSYFYSYLNAFLV